MGAEINARRLQCQDVKDESRQLLQVLESAHLRPLQGRINLWQDAAISDDVKIRGGVDLLTGLLYAPTAKLDVGGSGSTGTVQIIVNKFYIHGGEPLDIAFGEFVETDIPEVALVE